VIRFGKEQSVLAGGQASSTIASHTISPQPGTSAEPQVVPQ
jgi:hypothetical protein